MDIERELEILIDKHKGKQVGLGEIRLDWFAEDCLKEIRRLKSAVARQSVKSENVGRNNLLLVEIKHLVQTEDMDIWNYKNELISLLDEAIEQQPATSEDAFPSAIKWTGKNLREVIDLTGWNESASSKWTWAEYEQVVEEKGLKIFTPSCSVMADIGDWIIYNGKDCYVTAQKNKSATSEELPIP